jgi:hypothetical protein
MSIETTGRIVGDRSDLAAFALQRVQREPGDLVLADRRGYGMHNAGAWIAGNSARPTYETQNLGSAVTHTFVKRHRNVVNHIAANDRCDAPLGRSDAGGLDRPRIPPGVLSRLPKP